MKKSTRRTMMMSSLAMLIVAVLALGTATYAWFTASSNGYVSEIEFTATSADGISFSVTGAPNTWHSNLKLSDFEGDGKSQADPTMDFIPVSIHDNGATSGYFNVFGANKADDNEGNFETMAASSGFYRLEFYVRNTSSDNAFNLALSNVEIDASSTTNTTYAVRVGAVLWGNELSYETAITNPSTANGVETLIYDPVPSDHITGSESGYKNYYAVTIASNGYDQAADPDNEYIIASDQSAVTLVSNIQYGNNKVIGSIAPGTARKIVVYIWLEGQDSDCINDIARGTVKMTIGFVKMGD